MLFVSRSNHADSNSLEDAKALYKELTDEQAEIVSGGGVRPCNDEENDTGCYSLVTLECRVVASTSPQLTTLTNVI